MFLYVSQGLVNLPNVKMRLEFLQDRIRKIAQMDEFRANLQKPVLLFVAEGGRLELKFRSSRSSFCCKRVYMCEYMCYFPDIGRFK